MVLLFTGVLWLGNKVIPGSPDAINTLQKLGKKVYYITNNSTKTRREFVTKCTSMGYQATEDSIVSTAFLTACYLQDINFNKKVYVIGSQGITQELDAIGIKYLDIGPDTMNCDMPTLLREKVALEPDVGAVVVGFDEHISFPKMLKAASYLKQKECVFVATNTDEQFPTEYPHLTVPGTGTFVKAIETCSGREAFKIGKPSPYVGEAIIKRHNVDPNRTLMIGDRCNTDILFGTLCGFKTLLVLTGVTTLQEVKKWQTSSKKEEQDLVPNYYTQSLADLLSLL
ncbi:hypothetical protein L9F63_016261 [Diploptera punctata]|uniref:Phosphoglycolate phosphatase n=1 Tax=Diploptera punctata TaxID=6984 RepID=A0AAD8A264_DIPPU|nr:hypothetical protein L9F63_016261 [Diploptera punctata]